MNEQVAARTATAPSLRQRGARGAMWTFAKTIYTSGAQLLSIMVLARLLPAADFGLVSLASVFVMLMALVTDLGLTPALIRIAQPSRSQTDTAFWCSFIVSSALCGAVVIAAPALALWLHQPELRAIISVLAIQIPVASLRLVPVATLTREMRFRPLAMREIAAVTAGTVGAIPLALAGYGAWALVFQSLGGVAIDVAILWRSVAWRPSLRFDVAEARSLLKFGLSALVTQLLRTGRDRAVDLTIGAAAGTAALGTWVVGSRIANTVLLLFTAVLGAVSLPVFSTIKDDRARLARAFRHAMGSSAGLALPAMVGLAAVSATLIPLSFGAQWRSSVPIAEVVALTAAAAALSWVDSTLWWALGRPSVEFKLTLVVSLAQVGLAVLFAPHGVLAVALAMLARNVLTVPLRAIVVVRSAHMPWSTYADVPRALCAALPMAAVILMLRFGLAGTSPWISAACQVGAGAATYLATSALFQRRLLREAAHDISSALGRRG